MSLNLNAKLSAKIGVNDIHEITFLAQGNHSFKAELYKLFFDNDERIAYNAGWAMTHFNLNENEWLYDKQNELIEELYISKHTGKRRLILTLLCRQPLADPPRVDFLDYCLENMMSNNEPNWTRALFMKLAYEQCRTIPELSQELHSMLDMMEPSLLSSALRGTRSNILKAIKTGKGLELY